MDLGIEESSIALPPLRFGPCSKCITAASYWSSPAAWRSRGRRSRARAARGRGALVGLRRAREELPEVCSSWRSARSKGSDSPWSAQSNSQRLSWRRATGHGQCAAPAPSLPTGPNGHCGQKHSSSSAPILITSGRPKSGGRDSLPLAPATIEPGNGRSRRFEGLAALDAPCDLLFLPAGERSRGPCRNCRAAGHRGRFGLEVAAADQLLNVSLGALDDLDREGDRDLQTACQSQNPHY
jgi:hypothetical protein